MRPRALNYHPPAPLPSQAGITTTLNSRCSVLAAANSVFGRWDETKGEDNIDFMPTILSRFDMIFIVKDEHNEERDVVRWGLCLGPQGRAPARSTVLEEANLGAWRGVLTIRLVCTWQPRRWQLRTLESLELGHQSPASPVRVCSAI